MAKTGKPSEPPKTTENKPADNKAKRAPRRPQTDDDDYEDGDIATPKRDRYGPDDEPF
ncbi:hypothetical protein I6F30_24650 [Bradyrhizobium sp. NBAIM20]|uniref:Uncharacterized protein n=1 Tax=Bradyrhizobium yuanmingense TaxID=108015 RepID=A0A1C3WN66_9BRAD|nr:MULTISPECIES: hypothetical protein [Bradyrhizobium]MCA1414319.1 hypothetical protein [Bradyrhizobium sp. NBAIM20]MCA1437537.1 hypothetical protein [Bradyrhizobium sp. BRP20]MCA1465575.1 hypothetical protein [Bradyrhizobium sp. NBAIM18]MCA1550519.1 hypothetical protein [Bradyrhizobium sp. BRP19]TWI24374.1 hypothetical protein IQ15_04245 [Bradyrhizobium yuanmingense]